MGGFKRQKVIPIPSSLSFPGPGVSLPRRLDFCSLPLKKWYVVSRCYNFTFSNHHLFALRSFIQKSEV